MKASWFNVVDIIPVANSSVGWSVLVHGREGLVYEDTSLWSLMLKLNPVDIIPEDKWLSIACLLLSSYGDLGCGLCTFQGKWWLSCSYINSPNENETSVDISMEISAQVSLASFIEQWPATMQCNKYTAMDTNNSVPNKWA